MPQPFYVNPPWADIVTTTRENRAAEHGSLFNPNPEKIGKPSPVHPIIPHTPKLGGRLGKYKIRKTPSGKYK